jgi:hypothetical protein
MFQSKDGKKFGSGFVAKRRDSEHDKMAKDVMGDTSKKPTMSPEHEAAETPEFEKGEQEGAQESMHEAPEQVAQEHGPATTVHVSHDHKNKKHHVVSTHPDGHVHTSDHENAGEAHKAAGALAGGDQSPSGEAQAATEAPEADGFSMPRLA